MATILILANNDIGLYKFRRELIEKLLKQYRVVISLPYGEYIKELIDLGCEFIETYINRRGKNPFTDIKLIIQYKKLIQKIKPDIVLSYTIKPNIYGGIVCRFTKTAYIPNITGLGAAIENGGLLQKFTLILYKVALKRAACIFFQNKENAIFFNNKGIIKTRYRIIPGSGVNLAYHKFELYPDYRDVLCFTFIGRLMQDKGIDELIEAAKRCKIKHNNIKFLVIGHYEDQFINVINTKISNSVLELLGAKSDIRPYLKQCHALIHPSYHEGMANVILEAAATGRPVLASNIPGCREAFEEGVTGFGFETKNVDSLVAVIEKFIALPYELKAAMGISGRKKMEREFDRNIVINAYMEEIRVVCGVEQEKSMHDRFV